MLILRTEKRESPEIFMFYIYVVQQKNIFITESVLFPLLFLQRKEKHLNNSFQVMMELFHF